jgi:tagatose-1,6-bisphosphate aldolase non-catalytic subunit AgaZ/GatZ
MSNSRAKYEELVHEADSQSQHQKAMYTILDVLRAANKAGLTEVLLDKAMILSQSAPRLSPLVIIQLAAEEAKVDELCN